MFAEIDTKLTSAVKVEATASYAEMFPQSDVQFVTKAFSWASDCFNGRHEDYQLIDACKSALENGSGVEISGPIRLRKIDGLC